MRRLLTITAILGGLANLRAAPILVDDFGIDQTILLGSGGANPKTVSNGIATPGALGGNRTVSVTRTAGNSLAYAEIMGGSALMTSGNNNVRALFTWDGDTNPLLNTTGLGGIDLTSGGSNIYFTLAMRSDLANAPVTITVYTNSGLASSFTLLTPGLGIDQPFTTSVISMASFTALSGFTAADFTNVGAITLQIDGTTTPRGLDVELDLFQASPVPEPGTSALIGVGLVGASLASRKFRGT